MNDKISALVDAELTPHEVDAALQSVSVDRSLRGTWERYHLMRAAMRNEGLYVVSDLSRRIAAAVEKDAVVPLRRRELSRHTLYKGLTGLALAATVAAVSIGGIRMMWPQASTPQLATTAPAKSQTTAVATAANPRRGIHWDTRQPELENTLNAYLVQHSEFTRTSGMGVMSYVRIAGYDSSRPSSNE